MYILTTLEFPTYYSSLTRCIGSCVRLDKFSLTMFAHSLLGSMVWIRTLGFNYTKNLGRLSAAGASNKVETAVSFHNLQDLNFKWTNSHCSGLWRRVSSDATHNSLSSCFPCTHEQFSFFKSWHDQLLNKAPCRGINLSILCCTHEQIKLVKKKIGVS